MATKQAMTLEQIQQQKAEFEKKLLELAQQETNIIEESKAEAYTSLIEVINKYRLTGIEVINTLLNNGKIEHKDLSKIKPINLITKQIQKKKKNSDEMVNSEFNYFEGKTIISDKAQAEFVCSTGVDSFKATLTEAGKAYLADENKKHVIIDFYNTYKPSTATKWDGQ
ncbi:hypothetical protein [Klebsiella quasipneumoniae]|uniref:hypothetical protein n=1 Tax=Klebsiella quasipneumoniae TaxID=1463165 RepID=UPI002E78752F|nr:hypothetical protein [Klebsiella quasipneumoniae]